MLRGAWLIPGRSYYLNSGHPRESLQSLILQAYLIASTSLESLPVRLAMALEHGRQAQLNI